MWFFYPEQSFCSEHVFRLFFSSITHHYSVLVAFLFMFIEFFSDVLYFLMFSTMFSKKGSYVLKTSNDHLSKSKGMGRKSLSQLIDIEQHYCSDIYDGMPKFLIAVCLFVIAMKCITTYW